MSWRIKSNPLNFKYFFNKFYGNALKSDNNVLRSELQHSLIRTQNGFAIGIRSIWYFTLWIENIELFLSTKRQSGP